jgi:hypothetical protein
VSVANGSTAARNDHNLNGPLVLYQGPTDQWAGFKLALGSEGIKAADDGLDLGARIP